MLKKLFLLCLLVCSVHVAYGQATTLVGTMNGPGGQPFNGTLVLTLQRPIGSNTGNPDCGDSMVVGSVTINVVNGEIPAPNIYGTDCQINGGPVPYNVKMIDSGGNNIANDVWLIGPAPTFDIGTAQSYYPVVPDGSGGGSGGGGSGVSNALYIQGTGVSTTPPVGNQGLFLFGSLYQPGWADANLNPASVTGGQGMMYSNAPGAVTEDGNITTDGAGNLTLSGSLQVQGVTLLDNSLTILDGTIINFSNDNTDPNMVMLVGYANTSITATSFGSGLGTVTCTLATCDANRGSVNVSGGTFTIGDFLTIDWTALGLINPPGLCTIYQTGGTTWLGLHTDGSPSVSGVGVSTTNSIAGLNFNFDYRCTP